MPSSPADRPTQRPCERRSSTRNYISTLYLIIAVFSSTSLSLFASAIPKIVKHRIPRVNWTGRWVEIEAVVTLGLCWFFFYLLFWFGSKFTVDKTFAISITFCGLLITILVLVASAGASDLWTPVDSGSGDDEVVTYLRCNTIARTGPDCGVYMLRCTGILQICGITFLVLTLLCDIILVVVTYRNQGDELWALWRKKWAEIWEKRLAIGSRNQSVGAEKHEDVHFENEIPKTG